MFHSYDSMLGKPEIVKPELKIDAIQYSRIPWANRLSFSEVRHLIELNERQTKISFEVFKVDATEREQIKKAISTYHNKNHKPI